MRKRMRKRMKKLLATLLVMIMVCALAACSPPPEPEKTVVFSDPLLEEMVRTAMNKPEGDITLAEAETVTELKLSIDWQQEPAPNTQIKDISGLENFKNLEILELHFHAITDISPLAGLTKLANLSLGGNPIADITPLAGLTSLGALTLFSCQAQDYTPLANLTGLGMLLMDHSTISDVSMLSGLTELWWLGLTNTQVSDVSPLTTLTNLRKLQLSQMRQFTFETAQKVLRHSIIIGVTFGTCSAKSPVAPGAPGAPRTHKIPCRKDYNQQLTLPLLGGAPHKQKCTPWQLSIKI